MEAEADIHWNFQDVFNASNSILPRSEPQQGEERPSAATESLPQIDPPTHQEYPDLLSSHPRPPEEGERLREPYLVMRHQ